MEVIRKDPTAEESLAACAGDEADVLNYDSLLRELLPFNLEGSVSRVVGLTLAVADFPAPLGALCEVRSESGRPLEAEVVGFQDGTAVLLPYGELEGVRPGSRVRLRRSTATLRVGRELLGRVLDGRGRPVDGEPEPALPHRAKLFRSAPQALERPRIDEPLGTGVRAIDGLLTCGRGGRVGVFASSGLGKSVLLGQMARHSAADVNVVALVGERGREVREFIERDLGPEGLARSVLVVATSDEPALMRLRAAYVATAVAEHFRDQGADVLLVMDSVTRFAYSQREIGLAAGEPPATRGYPPSVFSQLSRLLERSGRSARGSITGFYTVLLDGDEIGDPIGDAVRSTLDGHVWLSRKLANRGHWPAIDVLASISRVMPEVTTAEHRAAAAVIRELLAAYEEAEDLIAIGAYKAGSNPQVDRAIQMRDAVNRFLRQDRDEGATLEGARQGLQQLVGVTSGASNTAGTEA